MTSSEDSSSSDDDDGDINDETSNRNAVKFENEDVLVIFLF